MIEGFLTFWGVMSYRTAACNPLRIRFSDIVFRSLAARIESMMVMNDISTSGATTIAMPMNQQLSMKRLRSLSKRKYSQDMMGPMSTNRLKEGHKRNDKGRKVVERRVEVNVDSNSGMLAPLHRIRTWLLNGELALICMYFFPRLHAASGGDE